MKFRALWFATIFGALNLLFIVGANAVPVTYYFGGVITSASGPCPSPCDPSLVGPGSGAIGTHFSGQYTFDSALPLIYSDPGERHYASALGDPAYGWSLSLGGVNFSTSGIYLEVSQNPVNPHYQAQRYSDGTNGFAGGQPLAHLNLGFILQFGPSPWGDGTTNIPSTVPLVSQFADPVFIFEAFTSHGSDVVEVGQQYRGYIDYLGTSPVPSVPLPAALPLFAIGLGALALFGWRRKRNATLAASLVAVAATALFVATDYAAAVTIDILQVNNHIAGGSPAAPAGFTLLDLGTGSPNTQQTTSTFTVSGVTFSFSGGSAEWAGNSANSSPFGFDNATKNFVAAANGNVGVTWSTTQNELNVLWGTVDPEPGRNVITIGATQIDGAAIVAAIVDQGFTLYDHQSNTYLRITGLPDFTSATFSSNDPSFEFALGTTPLPAALPLFVTGLGTLGLIGWRRERKSKAAA